MNIKQKYTPNSIKKIKYNKDSVLKLYDYLKYKNHNNIILYGLKNSGKNLAIDLCLRKIYPEYYDKTTTTIKNNIYYKYSSIHYHFYFNIKTKIEDLLPIIKEISNCKKFYTDIPYNIFIFDNFQNINIIFQESLRKIMEELSNTKIIIITNKINYLIDPLKSRCITHCIPSNIDKLYKFTQYILNKEKYNIPNNLKTFVENSENINNLLEDLNIEFLKRCPNNNSDFEIIKPLRFNIYDNIIQLLCKNKFTQKDIDKVKDLSHNILITNNDLDFFMKDFFKYMIDLTYKKKYLKKDLKIDLCNYINYNKQLEIIKIFSEYSFLLIKSYRKIIYIESLLFNLHRIFHE